MSTSHSLHKTVSGQELGGFDTDKFYYYAQDKVKALFWELNAKLTGTCLMHTENCDESFRYIEAVLSMIVRQALICIGGSSSLSVAVNTLLHNVMDKEGVKSDDMLNKLSDKYHIKRLSDRHSQACGENDELRKMSRALAQECLAKSSKFIEENTWQMRLDINPNDGRAWALKELSEMGEANA
jgi:hypothetical protein